MSIYLLHPHQPVSNPEPVSIEEGLHRLAPHLDEVGLSILRNIAERVKPAVYAGLGQRCRRLSERQEAWLRVNCRRHGVAIKESDLERFSQFFGPASRH
jgi:hypothetical protein